MSLHLAVRWGYRVATTLILFGFAMLCQPFARTLFAFGFPVLFVGVVLFMILDHVPDTQPLQEENRG
jgi:hypothetical protein